MQAAIIKSFGGPEVLVLAEVRDPSPGKGEVLVRVRATGVNRADALQRQGLYPPPADAPQDIPGLEFAGEVLEPGDGVQNWQRGDRVYGLAPGGTYAELLVTHAATVARIPDNLSFVEAAAIPEAFITAYDAAVVQAQLEPGERMLVTAVGSGVGTAAVQIARAIGATAFGTARSPEKLERAKQLGMHDGVLSLDGEYASAVNILTGNVGVNVVLELVGGKHLQEDVVCCAAKGRIMVVGLLGGAKCTADLGMILRKRLTIKGTTMRMRPLMEKIAAANLLRDNLNPLFANGQLKPLVDQTFKLGESAAAHAYMEANKNFGKIVIEI